MDLYDPPKPNPAFPKAVAFKDKNALEHHQPA
jgi:hypothetical protein